MKALFISPHLDDVAFSCGGTLARMIHHGWEITLLTVFTASMPNPHGFALRCQTDKGIAPEVDYMRLRRAEDQRFAALVGKPWVVHWPFPEAPHRGYESPQALFAGMRVEDVIWQEIGADLRRFAHKLQPDVVFAPQGLGNHVDHLHVIEAVHLAGLTDITCWYRDTPYAIRDPYAAASSRLPQSLVECAVTIDEALDTKIHGCGAYATQIGFQFGGVEAAHAKLRAFHAAEATRLGVQEYAEALQVPAGTDCAAWFDKERQASSLHNGQQTTNNGQQTTNNLVSIIILNYNSKDLLPRAVESVLDQTYTPLELIIVDNASTDGSADILPYYESVATVVRCHENTGFARGMNAGYAASRGTYVVPMNVDAVLAKTFVAEAVQLLRTHPNVGVIAPEVFKLYQGDEWRFWLSEVIRPTPLVSEGGVVALTPNMRVHVPKSQPGDWRSSFKANGACPVVRRALVEHMARVFGAAPFDPVFDTYGEDVDFAFKAWALGFSTMFARWVQAGHIRSYASPVELADKRGRLRANLVAERYINAIRHIPTQKLGSFVLRALGEDAMLVIRQRLKGDTRAARDVAVGLRRVIAMWPALLHFRLLHKTWTRIDFEQNVYCR